MGIEPRQSAPLAKEMTVLFKKMENLAGLWIKYLQAPEKSNILVARRAETYGKRIHKKR
jgi:hypothetical protein